MPGLKLQSYRWEVRVLHLHHCGRDLCINKVCSNCSNFKFGLYRIIIYIWVDLLISKLILTILLSISLIQMHIVSLYICLLFSADSRRLFSAFKIYSSADLLPNLEFEFFILLTPYSLPTLVNLQVLFIFLDTLQDIPGLKYIQFQ